MTNSISASEANQQFSSLLRKVQEGEDFVVLSRGRPVARVVPYEEAPKTKDVRRLLKELQELPIRVLPNWKRDDLYS
jgi:prevent-host-death family protein